LFKDFNIDSYFCLKPENKEKNTTTFGIFGDMKNGHSYWNLYVSKCQNKSIYNIDNVKCSPQSEIDSVLDKTIYVRVAYVDFSVNHRNEVPITPIVKSDSIQVMTKFNPRSYYYFSNEVYRTDNGILGENFEFTNFTTFSEVQNVLSINSFVVPESFALISFIISNKGNMYTRSYPKLQTLIANIGGVVNSVIIIMRFISYNISRKITMAYQINSIFKLKENYE
jgi:hypothetical protein